jgi:drug/metabolite transporter (DMT)-like permease
MNQYKKIIAYLAVLGTTVFWGMSFVWTEQVLKFYSPTTIIFIRLLLASLLLGGFTLSINKIQKIKLKDLPIFILMAFFQPFLYFLGEGYGIKFTSASVSSIIISTIPLITPLGAWLFLKERVSVMNIVGLFVSFVGVVLIIFEKNFSMVSSMIGVYCLLGAVFTAIGYTVTVRILSAKYNVFTINVYQSIFGVILFLPFFIYSGWEEVTTVKITQEAVMYLVQLAVFASALAFLFFSVAIKELGITKASAFNNGIPVVTVLVAFFYFGEFISMQKIAGMAVVLLGLFVAQWKLKRKNTIE